MLEQNEYFIHKLDTTGKMGLTNLQKCTTAIRQLAYGTPSDATDEYVRMGDSAARKCLIKFCRTVCSLFEEKYLRSPIREDHQRLLHIGEKYSSPGVLGSLDCIHWKWKNCPTAWAGQYRGKKTYNHSRSSGMPISLDLACIFWNGWF